MRRPSNPPTEPPAGPVVRDLPESELLERVFPLLPAGATTIVGPGDDGAVVAAPDGRYVVSTDVLVEDRHFRRRWSTGYDVGWRAAMQNLADVAAMGAWPSALVVSLVMPGDLPVDWVTGLARGLAAACGPSGASVVGGDLSGGDQVVVAVTVHGDLAGRAPVLRSGARPGDVVAHAGRRGWSAAGLGLLEAGLAELDDALVTAHLRPDPPLEAGPAAAAAGASALLDVSDGLLRDAARVARASGVVLDLVEGAFGADAERLRAAARALVGPGGPAEGTRDVGDVVRTWVLTGGEDHGLLATFPPGVTLPAPFRAVGTVRAAAAGEPVLVDGRAARVHGTGWDHFGG